MIHLRGLGAVILMAGALFSRPAAAQIRGSSSLTHVVSVTVPPRVKVKVSSISMTPSRAVPAAVKVTAAPASTSGLALSVHANQAWVLSVSAPAARSTTASKVLWSGTETGRFTAITPGDAPLAAGTQSPAAVDTTAYFRGPASAPSAVPVVLTVSSP